jgi:two-component system, cell cycle response regulator
MTDSVRRRLEALSAQLDGLETAAAGLGDDPGVCVSVRRIARSLETAAQSAGLREVAAGAMAIQRAADAHLTRSVANFLARIAELRDEGPVDEVTVLVVEDNRTVAAATQAYLKAPGRTIVVAESAAEAASIMAARPVDVVVLDLILPDRDGRDVLVQMREEAATSTIPVIVLSSTSSPVARAECLAVGADEFVEKPADPKTLRAAVARQIENGKQRSDAVRDGLTGLPNRAGIAAEFERQRRSTAEAGEPLCVAALTLDSLAEVTMKLGRDAGDRFLLEVCSAVHEAIGKGDRLGRWETAGLVALLPGRTSTEAKEELESTLRFLTEGEVLAEYRDAGIDAGLSGGITLVERSQDLHAAISAAEKSLYTARLSDLEAVVADGDPLALSLQTILLVEDDRVTATLIHHRLVRDGHEVVDFLNGAEAFSWARENDVDLAILDVKVPGMDGFELLAKLRGLPHLSDVPIIMLTGMGSETDVIRGLELGADDYMLKPFSPSELLARVRRHLHARAAEASGAGPGRQPALAEQPEGPAPSPQEPSPTPKEAQG